MNDINEIFVAEFNSSQHGNEYKIEISKKVSAIDVPTGDTKFTISGVQGDSIYYNFILGDEDPTIEYDTKNDFLEPVIGSQLRFNVLVDGIPSWLIAKNCLDIPVTLWRGKNPIWFGFLVPLSLNDRYARDTETMSLVALDIVGVSKYLTYTPKDKSHTDDHKLSTYAYNYGKLISEAQPLMYNRWHVEDNCRMQDNSTTKAWEKIYVNDRVWYDFDEEEHNSKWFDVLYDIAQWMSLTICQFEGEFYAYDPVLPTHTFNNYYYSEYSQNQMQSEPRYTVTSADYRTDATSVSYGTNYSKVSVKSEPVQFQSYDLGQDTKQIKSFYAAMGEVLSPESYSWNEFWRSLWYGNDSLNHVTNFTQKKYITLERDTESAHVDYNTTAITPDQAAFVQYTPSYSAQVTGMDWPDQTIDNRNFQDWLMFHQGAIPIKYGSFDEAHFGDSRECDFAVLVDNQGWSNFYNSWQNNFPKGAAFTYRPFLDSTKIVGQGYLCIDFDVMFADYNKSTSGNYINGGQAQNVKLFPSQDTRESYTTSAGTNSFYPIKFDPYVYATLKIGNKWWNGSSWQDTKTDFVINVGKQHIRSENKKDQKKVMDKLAAGTLQAAGYLAPEVAVLAENGVTSIEAVGAIASTAGGVAAGILGGAAMLAYGWWCQSQYDKEVGTVNDGSNSRWVQWQYQWMQPTGSNNGYMIPFNLADGGLPNGQIEFSIEYGQPTWGLLSPVVYMWVKDVQISIMSPTAMNGEEDKKIEEKYTITSLDPNFNGKMEKTLMFNSWNRLNGGFFTNTPTWNKDMKRIPVERMCWSDYSQIGMTNEKYIMSRLARQIAFGNEQLTVTTEADLVNSKSAPWTIWDFCFEHGDYMTMGESINLRHDTIAVSALKNNRNNSGYTPFNEEVIVYWNDNSSSAYMWSQTGATTFSGSVTATGVDMSNLLELNTGTLEGVFSGCPIMEWAIWPSIPEVSGDYYFKDIFSFTQLSEIDMSPLVGVSGSNCWQDSFQKCQITAVTANASTMQSSGTYDNPMPNLPVTVELTLADQIGDNANVFLDANYALSSASVRNILWNLSNATGSRVRFYTGVTAVGYTGLVFTDDEQGTLTRAYQDATGSNTVQNLTILQPIHDDYAVSFHASPSSGGTVPASMVTRYGTEVTAKAVPNHGFDFVDWRDSGGVVSTAAVFSFTVTANVSLTASFSAQSEYLVSTTVSPAGYGTVSGGGNYFIGDIAILETEPINGTKFKGWYSSGQLLSNERRMQLTVTGDQSVTAQYYDTGSTISVTAKTNISGDARAIGGGEYNSGSVAVLRTELSDDTAINYVFDGWYLNGNLVSTDNPYYLSVTQSGEYIARWTAQSLLNVTPTELDFEESGGTKIIIIESDSDWTITT